MINKKHIIGLNKEELQKLCLEFGEPKFRAEQLYEWIYRHGCSNFELMDNINKSFRNFLNKHYILNTLEVDTKYSSSQDKSIKILFKTHDGQFIESVSMVDGNRHTVCLSSQIGCALDCKFCATGKLGLKRNLTAGEIIEQLIYIKKNINYPITNVVFMGMGEPFHNYDNVLNASDIFHHPKGFNLAASAIAFAPANFIFSVI